MLNLKELKERVDKAFEEAENPENVEVRGMLWPNDEFYIMKTDVDKDRVFYLESQEFEGKEEEIPWSWKYPILYQLSLAALIWTPIFILLLLTTLLSGT